MSVLSETMRRKAALSSAPSSKRRAGVGASAPPQGCESLFADVISMCRVSFRSVLLLWRAEELEAVDCRAHAVHRPFVLDAHHSRDAVHRHRPAGKFLEVEPK